MILNQISGNGGVERGITKAIDQQEMARQAADAKADARRMQVFVRDLRLARAEADIKAGEDGLVAAGREADRLADDMYRRSVSAENKTRILELRKQIDAYTVAGRRVADNRRRLIVAQEAGRVPEIASLEAEVADIVRTATGAASAQVPASARSLSTDGERLKQEVDGFLARVRAA